MRTFSSTPWRDGTFWEFCFIPVTIKHISPDFTTSLSKPVWSHNRHSNPTIQPSTEDTGSSHIPACITHCAPFTEILMFNSTRTDVRAIYQPEISVTWTKNREFNLTVWNMQKKYVWKTYQNITVQCHSHGYSYIWEMMMLDRKIYKIHFLCTESLVSTSERLLCQKQLLPAPVQEPHSPALYTQPLHPAGQRQHHTLCAMCSLESALISQSTGETHLQA